MTYAEASAILGQCNHDNRNCEISTGQRVCCECWNRHVEARRQARKDELAALPRCACCNRRGTLNSFGVLLCGHHFGNVKRAHHNAIVGLGGLGLFATPNYRPEDILKMAKG